MKKNLIASLAVALCASFATAADQPYVVDGPLLVYDYAVSFKRIEATPKYISPKEGMFKGGKVHYDSPKVVSDKLKGYVVVKACDDCFLGKNETGRELLLDAMYTSRINNAVNFETFEDDKAKREDPYYYKKQDSDNVAVVYIQRTGKARNNVEKKSVYRAVGGFTAAMFGAKATALSPIADGKTATESNPEYWYLNKVTDSTSMLVYPMYWGKYFAKDYSYWNFLGQGGDEQMRFDENSALTSNMDPLGNMYAYGYYGIETNWCYNGGFGKISSLYSKETVTITEAGCIPSTTTDVTETNCFAVKSASGSMLAMTQYNGYCSHFVFDLCEDMNFDHYYGPAKEYEMQSALPGTYTLKLNNGLTFNKKNFRFSSFADVEEEILEKLKATSLYIPFTDHEMWDGKNLGLRDGVVFGGSDF